MITLIELSDGEGDQTPILTSNSFSVLTEDTDSEDNTPGVEKQKKKNYKRGKKRREKFGKQKRGRRHRIRQGHRNRNEGYKR